MKKIVTIIILLLLTWNIVLSVQVYRLNERSVGTTTKVIREQVTDINSDVSELVKKSERKVVTVVSKESGQTRSSGSGAIYKVKDNEVYIITNNHVIDESDQVIVYFSDDKDIEAEVLGRDALSDLAVLKVNVDFESEAFAIGDSSLTKKGEFVIAMGSPLGIQYKGSVSGGWISGTDRKIQMDLDGNGVADWDMVVLQSDAAINPGNSGGPLINMAGELIGINSMKISNTEVEGFGFAIPINEAIPIVEQLESDGEITRPIIGISARSIEELTSYDRKYLKIDKDIQQGLIIISTTKNSPAEKAGIKAGDVVISIDGHKISSFKTFRQLLYEKKVGDKVELEIIRDKKVSKIPVVLE